MPNNDYILRSDALKAVCETCSEHGEEGESCASHCGDYALIQNIPAADVEPVRHGRWIPHETDDGFSNGVQCTVCGEWFYKYFTYNYCPDCGAKMQGEVDNE